MVLIALDNYKNRLPIQGHVKDAIDLKWNIYSKYEIDEIVELYNIDANYANIDNLTFIDRFICTCLCSGIHHEQI